MIHIVICDNKDCELEKIKNKERTLLIRGGASRRIPHSRIYINDELYFVEKGETISKYHATVKDATNYSKLTNNEINEIYDKYKNNLNLTKKEEKKWLNKCMCIIDFDNFTEIDDVNIPPYSNLNDWIMVDSIDELN